MSEKSPNKEGAENIHNFENLSKASGKNENLALVTSV